VGRSALSQVRAVVVLGLMLLVVSCTNRISVAPSTDSTLDRITKEKVLRVGYIVYPPAVVKDPQTGELSGEFVDIARYIADEIGARLEFHETSWSTFVAGLQAGQYDISIAPTYAKVSRAASVHFSEPIAYLGNSAVVLKNNSSLSGVKTAQEFDHKGLRVAVVQGEAAHEFATTHFKNAQVIVLSGSDLSAPCIAVISGQADVGLTDAYVTSRCAAEHTQLLDVFASNPYDLSPMAWSVRNSDVSLLIFINNSLEYVSSSGRLREIESKYNAHWLHRSTTWERW